MSDADGVSGNGAPAGGVPLTKFDDPHLQPYAKNPRRAEMLIGVLLLLGLAGFCAYGGLYWVGGQPQWEGVFGGVGFFAFGFGLSAWGKYLLPQGPFVEDRHALASTEPEVVAMAAAIEDRGKMVFRRRGFLGTILGAGAGVMGVVLAFPLLRSLGPPPKKTFDTTDWRTGSYLVDIDGNRVHQADLEVGGALTVFPEGFAGASVDQTMLIRAETTDIVTMARTRDVGPEGIPGVLEDVHPRRMPRGPVRGGDPAIVVPVSPVAVRREDRRQPRVRSRPPPPAPAAAAHRQRRVHRGPGRL